MRLFVAILFGEPVLDELARVQSHLKTSCEGVRWTPREQLHLTVKFLGEVPDGEVRGVCDAVSRAAGASAAFRVTLDGCGCFPPRGPARIVWVGLNEPSGAMLGAAKAVASETEQAGIPTESRPWSAHVTIGRLREDRSGGRIREALGSCTVKRIEQPVASLALMSSVLSPKGSTYSVVHSAPLGG